MFEEEAKELAGERERGGLIEEERRKGRRAGVSKGERGGGGEEMSKGGRKGRVRMSGHEQLGHVGGGEETNARGVGKEMAFEPFVLKGRREE